MGLYLFEASADLLTFAPTDSDGIPIGSGVNESPLRDARTVHVRAMYNKRRDVLPDRLSVGVNRSVVVRSTLAERLAQHRMPTDLLAVQVVVWSKNGQRRLADDFVLLHSDEEYDVLDRTDSEYIAVHRGEHVEVIVNVTKWSILGTSVPPLDMFPAKPNDWMVTEAGKSVFDQLGVTGVKLTKVNVV